MCYGDTLTEHRYCAIPVYRLPLLTIHLLNCRYYTCVAFLPIYLRSFADDATICDFIVRCC